MILLHIFRQSRAFTNYLVPTYLPIVGTNTDEAHEAVVAGASVRAWRTLALVQIVALKDPKNHVKRSGIKSEL